MSLNKCCICAQEFSTLELYKQNLEYMCRECYIDNFLEGIRNHGVGGKLSLLALNTKGEARIRADLSNTFSKLLREQPKE